MKWWGNQCHWPCKSCQNVPRPSAKFEQLLIGYISKCKDRLSNSILASISQPYLIDVPKTIEPQPFLLAHLSRRLMGELIVYQSLRRPSVRPQFQTSSPLKPLGQLNSNFIWRLCKMGEWKFVQIVLAAMPIYGKNPLKIFFSRTRRPMTSGLGM